MEGYECRRGISGKRENRLLNAINGNRGERGRFPRLDGYAPKMYGPAKILLYDWFE